jgi:hypothetical protein
MKHLGHYENRALAINVPDIRVVLNAASVGFGLLAAGLWFWSAIVRMRYKDKTDKNGWTAAAITDDAGNDIVKTLGRQSFWSAWGAVAAAVAALCQAALLVL